MRLIKRPHTTSGVTNASKANNVLRRHTHQPPTGCSPFLSDLQADRHFWLNWLTAEPTVVQVNMLDAKSQLSRLVKAALAGEEVIIASHGKAQVKLVPCASAAGLKQLGALGAASPGLLASQVDAAFAEAVDQQVAELFNS